MAFIRTTLSAALKKAPGCRLTLHIACKREGATLHCICKGAPRPPLGEAKGEGAALYCTEKGARGCSKEKAHWDSKGIPYELSDIPKGSSIGFQRGPL